jgi:hypothetical protein
MSTEKNIYLPKNSARAFPIYALNFLGGRFLVSEHLQFIIFFFTAFKKI